ncbi:GTP-binding protein 10 homolog [Trichoplusia ni]|uniref:GTP-binding protein 10 homolog n=1 Tax=Trichoplusia ni TaxID=7111 RepID=A0A7E5WQ93_TRINI|nr:GTP-binding protein 10 homolog [Trichoplusia ni]
MVLIFRTLFAVKELKKPRSYLRSKFIDSVRLHVKGGTGGTGLPKFGGLGGQGGCVYCIGKEDANLRNIMGKYRGKTVTAGHGEDSRKSKIVGNPGADVKLEVPLGITVYREDGKVLGSIDKEDETVIIARGGPGGTPETNFLGHFGQIHHIRLDLKLIADIGLVGFPNAGKSSLLKAISRAKPKIANYPFTTIKPNKGIIFYEDLRQISIADLPGLIEGAHVNVGLGHSFLKHVERTKLLLFIADVQGFQLNPKYPIRSCLETILLLNKELELYDEELLQKPAVLAVNKMDLPGSDEILKNIKEAYRNEKTILQNVPEEMRPNKLISFDDIIGISALKRGESIKELKNILRKRLDDYADENDPNIVHPNKLLRQTRAIIRESGSKVT